MNLAQALRYVGEHGTLVTAKCSWRDFERLCRRIHRDGLVKQRRLTKKGRAKLAELEAKQ